VAAPSVSVAIIGVRGGEFRPVRGNSRFNETEDPSESAAVTLTAEEPWVLIFREFSLKPGSVPGARVPARGPNEPEVPPEAAALQDIGHWASPE
jgi:hypothetical protein